MKYSTLLILIIQIATLVAIIIGNIKYTYLKKFQLLPFFYLLIISLLSDLICLFLVYSGNHTTWITSFYTLFEFNIILFSIGSWIGVPTFSNFIRYLSAAYFLFWVWENFFQTFEFTVDLPDTLEGMILILLLSKYLLKLSNEYTGLLTENPKFWIASALLIYFAATIIIVGTPSLLFSSEIKLQHYTWVIHNIIHIFTSLLFIKGFLCIKVDQTS